MNQRHQALDAGHEAGSRQFVLLLEIIGDAGGDQADPFGDQRQRHPPDAAMVQELRRRGDDGVALAVEAGRGGGRERAVVHEASIVPWRELGWHPPNWMTPGYVRKHAGKKLPAVDMA